MKLQEERELRLSVIGPGGGSVVLTASASGEELTLFCVGRECRGHGLSGKIGTNYRQEFSYS